MTDYKQLCAKVLAYYEGQGAYDFSHLGAIAKDNAAFDAWQELRAELKTALAQPEPEGPTLDDIWELCEEHEFILADDISEEESGYVLWEIARAVLTRWGRPTPQPIPVSERLPGPELCWWYEPDDDDDGSGYGGSWTLLRIRGNTGSFRTHWLPAHALPLPNNTSRSI